MTPFLLVSAVARRDAANWLLAIGSDRLWINLRSLAARDAPAGESVVELSFRELRGARESVHRWQRPGGEGTVRQTDRYLDLFVDEAVASAIASWIASEEAIDVPPRQYLGGVLKVWSGGASRSLVSVPEPGLVRLACSTRAFRMRPNVKRVLEMLEERAPAFATAMREDPDPLKMDEAVFEERLGELLAAGDRFAAAQMLAVRHSVSLTEAMKALPSHESRFLASRLSEQKLGAS